MYVTLFKDNELLINKLNSLLFTLSHFLWISCICFSVFFVSLYFGSISGKYNKMNMFRIVVRWWFATKKNFRRLSLIVCFDWTYVEDPRWGWLVKHLSSCKIGCVKMFSEFKFCTLDKIPSQTRDDQNNWYRSSYLIPDGIYHLSTELHYENRSSTGW